MGLTKSYSGTKKFDRDIGNSRHYQNSQSTQPIYTKETEEEYGEDLVGIETEPQAKAGSVIYRINLENFKIKKITLFLREEPSVAGSCDWNSIIASKDGSLLSPVFSLSSPAPTTTVSQDITGLLANTIIDSLVITATGTPAGTAGLTWLLVEGFYL